MATDIEKLAQEIYVAVAREWNHRTPGQMIDAVIDPLIRSRVPALAAFEERVEHELTVLRIEDGDLVLVYSRGEYPREARCRLADIVSQRLAYIIWVPEGFRLDRLSEHEARSLYRRLRDLYGKEGDR